MIGVSFSDIKEREKAEKRNVIVNAAEKLFFEKGFDNVAMEDIAKEVGVNRATLYLYFKNKESLYFAVVLRGVRLMNETVRSHVGENMTGIERMEAFGNGYFEFNLHYGEYFKMLAYFGSGRFNVQYNDDAKEVHRLLHEMIDLMCKSLEAGMKDGTIRDDIDPMELTVFILTTAETIVGLRHNMRMSLKERGIEYGQYVQDTMKLLGSSMMSPCKANKG